MIHMTLLEKLARSEASERSSFGRRDGIHHFEPGDQLGDAFNKVATPGGAVVTCNGGAMRSFRRDPTGTKIWLPSRGRRVDRTGVAAASPTKATK